MTYVIHYSDLAQPTVTEVASVEAAADFMENLPDEQSAYVINDEDDLRQLPGATLIALFNASQPETLVKKFSDKKTAVTRTWPKLKFIAKTAEQAEEKPKRYEVKSPARGANHGVSALIIERLKAGDTTQQIVERLRKEIPISRAGSSEIASVRSRLRKKGELK